MCKWMSNHLSSARLVFCLTLLTSVWMPHHAHADNDVPRFYVSTDASVTFMIGDNPLIYYNAITPGQPFFSVFVWCYNTDGNDSKWRGKDGGPLLYIDEHPVRLTCLENPKNVDAISTGHVYTDNAKNPYCYVYVRDKFCYKSLAGTFDGLSKDGGHRDADYYVMCDVMLVNTTVGSQPKVRLYGSFEKDDDGTSYKDGQTPNNKTEASPSPTKSPFGKMPTVANWTSYTEALYEYSVNSITESLAVKNATIKISTQLGGNSNSCDVQTSDSSGHATKLPLKISYPAHTDVTEPHENQIDYVYRYTNTFGSETIEGIITDHIACQITPEPKLKFLQSQKDMWGKKITLDWETSSAVSAGKFIIKRTATASKESVKFEVVVKKQNQGESFSYTDETADYDMQYSYRIYYVPEGWSADDPSDDYMAIAPMTEKLERVYEIKNFVVTNYDDSNVLKWKLSSSSSYNTRPFYIYRTTDLTSEPDQIDWGNAINGDAGTTPSKDGSYEYIYTDKDIQTRTYRYKIEQVCMGETISSEIVQVSPVNYPKLVGLSATRGTMADQVKLTLKFDKMAKNDQAQCTISRSIYGENRYLEQTTDLFTSSLEATYADTAANAGTYYQYKVEAIINGETQMKSVQVTDGYARATGTLEGEITFEDGGRTQGVEGVRVTLKSNDTLLESQFSALQIDSLGAGLIWKPEQSATLSSTFYSEHGFGVQMYVAPDAKLAGQPTLFALSDAMRVYLQPQNDTTYQVAVRLGEETAVAQHLTIPAGRYTHLTINYGIGYVTLATAVAVGPDSTTYISEALKFQKPLDSYSSTDPSVTLGYTTHADNANYKGYIDEVRIFNCALTEAQILRNYNHTLGGDEEDLVAYWPLDETVETLPIVYDSRTNPANHAWVVGGTTVRSQTLVPTADQLSLFTYTDSKGAYTIQGIPIYNNKTTYTVIPTKGSHSFNPTDKPLTFDHNTSSLKQNFIDESSFEVSGTVYYQYTTYPVEQCQLYIDGIPCMDGEKYILTNQDGTFKISVPIGEHTITLGREGHRFVMNKDGHEEELAYTHNFNQRVSDLTFFDATKAVVVGRVVGGQVEAAKPLGMGNSKANIGRATLVLKTNNSDDTATPLNVIWTDGKSEANPQQRNYDVPADAEKVHSIAYTPAAEGELSDAHKAIYIHTDTVTGEFAVMLPPIKYYVVGLSIDNNNTIEFNDKGIIDASEVRTFTVDTLYDELGNVADSFAYNVSYHSTYHAPAQMTVVQSDPTASVPGAFGESKLTYYDVYDQAHDTLSYDTQLNYVVDYPVFKQGEEYTFEFDAKEVYYNLDKKPGEQGYMDEVKLAFAELNITNPLGIDSTTVQIDTNAKTSQHYTKELVFHLDSAGHYQYTFEAGVPDISNYSLPFEVSFTPVGSTRQSWYWHDSTPLRGIVLGSAPVGTQSLAKAKGSDAVFQIVRDPYGSESSCTWNEGSTNGGTIQFNGSFGGGRTVEYKRGSGTSVTTAAGMGVITVTSQQAQRLAEGKAAFNLEHHGSRGAGFTITTNESVSTSSDMWYDGAAADVYVGRSIMTSYDLSRNVQLQADASGHLSVTAEDGISVEDSFEAEFIYSQDYILNDLIPAWKRLRSNRLIQVSQEEYDTYATTHPNLTDTLYYVSYLTPEEEHYGEIGYYHTIWPQNLRPDRVYNDTVAYYTSQIELWEDYIRQNEQRKINAMRGNGKAYSFSHGTSYSYEHSIDWNVSVDPGITVKASTSRIKSGGIDVKGGAVSTFEAALEKEFGVEITINVGYSHTGKSSHTYTFAESNSDNVHDVTVYADGGFSPVFKQTAGVTSEIYEGQEVTQFAQPGYELSAATIQLEQPKILYTETTINDVPSNKSADFTVRLCNAASAVTSVTFPIKFELMTVSDDNAKNAKVSFNGRTSNPTFSLITDTVTQVISVALLNPDEVTNVDNLHIKFRSVGEPNISDDIYLNVGFRPAPYEVSFDTDLDLINTKTDTTIVLKAYDYNYNAKNLSAVRLQFRRGTSSEWTTIMNYVKELSGHDKTEALLPADGISYRFDMKDARNYTDGVYHFRAVTVSQTATGELLGESEEVEVVKDIRLPQLMYDPTPAILGYDDNSTIKLEFNEDISTEPLNKTDNFVMQGAKNESVVSHAIALTLPGSTQPQAISQVPLTMGNTSFTINTWLKLSPEGSGTTAGLIYRHGAPEEALGLAVTADAHLIIYKVNGTESFSATSDRVIPVDEWIYLSVTYDIESKKIEAHYAAASEDRSLFTQDIYATEEISADGYVYLGEGLTGAMHGVSLYEEAMDWATVQSAANNAKTRREEGIMCYWPFDEGHGSTASEAIHSRHMKVDADSWYRESNNLSLVLDQDSLAIPMGQHSLHDNESYLVEMWINADEATVADQHTARVFSMDNGRELDLLIRNGKLALEADSAIYETGKLVTANQWHHVAVNVLKGDKNSCAIMLDGEVCKTLLADKVPALQAAKLWLGKGFNGLIDEVRVWQGDVSTSVVSARMYQCISTDQNSDEYYAADGLVVYYPMEYFPYNEFNQRECQFADFNQVVGSTDETFYRYDPQHETASSTLNPGLQPAKLSQNVTFNFNAEKNGNVVTLDLKDEDPATIEDCTLTATMRNYYDQHGNVGRPITWNFVVKQNHLSWEDPKSGEVSLRVETGTEGKFTAKFANGSSEAEAWTLSGLPTWLQADAIKGNLSSKESAEVHFSVPASTSVGKYTTTVYLKGNQGILTPLVVSVNVTGTEPAWEVNPSQYRYSMNFFGQLKVKGITSSDPDDMIAAFVGNEVVGVARPSYVTSKDAYFVSMTVYGNTKGAPLTFKVYDASTGIICPVVNTVSPEGQDTTYLFTSNAMVGNFDAPMLWVPTNEVEQQVQLTAGWNNISFYVQPKVGKGSLANVFGNSAVTLVADAAERESELIDGVWTGTTPVDSIVGGQWYQVFASDNTVVSVVGDKINPTQYPYTIKPGMNYLGVPTYKTWSIEEAFASINPSQNDVVSDGRSTATYSVKGWETSNGLTTIQPGVGYSYRSAASETKTLTFPADAITQHTTVAKPSKLGSRYEMGAICTFRDQHGFVEDVIIKAINQNTGEVMGVSHRLSDCDAYYLRMVNDEKVVDSIYLLVEWAGGSYQTSAVLPEALGQFLHGNLVGTIESPIELRLNAVGLESIAPDADEQPVFDILGRRVDEKTYRGMKIKGEHKEMR